MTCFKSLCACSTMSRWQLFQKSANISVWTVSAHTHAYQIYYVVCYVIYAILYIGLSWCQWQRILLTKETQETRVWSLGQEYPLEKESAVHSSILAWKIPWTEKPGGLQSIGLQSQTWLSSYLTPNLTRAWIQTLPLPGWDLGGKFPDFSEPQS